MSNVSLAVIGTILKGRHKSNPDARAKVWCFNPDNPRRVCLWMKTGRFSWNNVSSLDVNYEAAPADEPTWPDPQRDPPQDVPRGHKEQTPVEMVAAAPEPAPTVDTSAPDEQDDEPMSEEAPPPAPRPDNSVTVVLRGETANLFRRQLLILNNAAALTGGEPMSGDDLVSKAVCRLVSQVMGGAL